MPAADRSNRNTAPRLMDRLYDLLYTTAAAHRTITYTEVAKNIGMQPGCIWPLLDDINRHEISQGRELLSAVVVGKSKSRTLPGDGFFHVARELGYSAPDPKEGASQEELREFWEAVLDKVYKVYSSRR